MGHRPRAWPTAPGHLPLKRMVAGCRRPPHEHKSVALRAGRQSAIQYAQAPIAQRLPLDHAAAFP